jgi:hypothetical protein
VYGGNWAIANGLKGIFLQTRARGRSFAMEQFFVSATRPRAPSYIRNRVTLEPWDGTLLAAAWSVCSAPRAPISLGDKVTHRLQGDSFSLDCVRCVNSHAAKCHLAARLRSRPGQA